VDARVVVLGVDVDDTEGTYRRWLADAGVVAVLERPDFAVFGTARDGADVHHLIGALEAAIAGTETRQEQGGDG
jgi:hypothetical protein